MDTAGKWIPRNLFKVTHLFGIPVEEVHYITLREQVFGKTDVLTKAPVVARSIEAFSMPVAHLSNSGFLHEKYFLVWRQEGLYDTYEVVSAVEEIYGVIPL